MIYLLIAVASFYILGLSLKIYFYRDKNINLDDFGEIFALGFGLSALLMIGFSILGWKFSRELFIFSVIPIFLLAYFWKKPNLVFPRLLPLSWLTSVTIILISLFILGIILKIFSQPIWGCDAYTLWLARARAFFIDKQINKDNLIRFWPAEHPPLWSLVIAWTYIIMDEANELLIRTLPLLFYILIVISFNKYLITGRWYKFLCLVILVTLPQLTLNVVDYSLAGNADLFLSFYFFIAISAILRKNFALAGLFFALGAWVKSDGTPAPLIYAILLFFLYSPKKLLPMLITFFPVVILFMAKYWLGISSRYFYHISARPYLDYLWYDLMAFREEMRSITNWHLLWWVFFFILVAKFKRILKHKELLLAYGVLLGQITSYGLIFLITPENQAGHIASAIYRLLLHVAPAALFLAGSLTASAW